MSKTIKLRLSDGTTFLLDKQMRQLAKATALLPGDQYSSLTVHEHQTAGHVVVHGVSDIRGVRREAGDLLANDSPLTVILRSVIAVSIRLDTPELLTNSISRELHRLETHDG